MQLTSYDRDFSLVRKAKCGSHAAFVKLVHLHDAPVLRLALLISGSESVAQNIYQEAFLQIFKDLAYFRYQCTFSAWIHRIATNVCLDHLRRNQKRQENSPKRVSVEGKEYDLPTQIFDKSLADNPEQQCRGCKLSADIRCALQELTSPVRTLSGMMEVQEMNLHFVSSAFITSEATAKTYLVRARQKLRLHLARYMMMRKTSMERHRNRGE
jgi:RNA polymerase sigma-70 factor, ECF subfamily